jgi:hypothetical protein
MFITLSDILLVISVIFIISAIIVIVYFAFYSSRFQGLLHKKGDRNILNDYSSFVSNFAGPLFAIGGSLILYSTIIEQNRKDNINRFESVYFKLVDYHRENNLNIKTSSDPFKGRELEGKQLFTNMYNHLKATSKLIHGIYPNITDSNLANISYQVFYIGKSSEPQRKQLKQSLKKYHGQIQIDTLFAVMDRFSDSIKTVNETRYHFFDGNKTKLSHYFTQYFNVVSYIFQQDFLTSEEKQFYLIMLQSQNGFYENIIINIYLMSDSATNEHKAMSEFAKLNKEEGEYIQQMLFSSTKSDSQ